MRFRKSSFKLNKTILNLSVGRLYFHDGNNHESVDDEKNDSIKITVSIKKKMRLKKIYSFIVLDKIKVIFKKDR